MKRLLNSRIRLRQWFVGLALLGTAQLAISQDFIWAPDYPVGAEFAEIEAVDQNGELHGFTDLVGENGLLFMFNRSFDW